MDELKMQLIKLGEQATDEEIAEMIQIADLDHDGKINRKEFSHFISTLGT